MTNKKGQFVYLSVRFLFCLAVVILVIGLCFGQFKFKTPTEVEGHIYRVTAFCSGSCCCGKWADGYTASGHKIEIGDKFCATPPEIPFGTILDIPGYGRVPVLDRGGTIKDRRLDVYFESHQEALNWGVKYLRIKSH